MRQFDMLPRELKPDFQDIANSRNDNSTIYGNIMWLTVTGLENVCILKRLY
jgi:hypothetical protein